MSHHDRGQSINTKLTDYTAIIQLSKLIIVTIVISGVPEFDCDTNVYVEVGTRDFNIRCVVKADPIVNDAKVISKSAAQGGNANPYTVDVEDAVSTE